MVLTTDLKKNWGGGKGVGDCLEFPWKYVQHDNVPWSEIPSKS